MCARCNIRTICSFIFFLQIYYSDGRVFCSDPRANNWTAVGYSCPLNCANVIAAIERLKVLDYSNIVDQETLSSKIRFEGMMNQKDTSSSEELIVREKQLLKESYFGRELLKPEDAINEVDADVMSMAVKKHLFLRTGNYPKNSTKLNACDSILQNKHLKKSLRKKLMMQCTRRQLDFDPDLIAVITTILNKHAHRGYHFDEAMVMMLLNRTLSGYWGTHAFLDIHNILRQLTSEIQQMQEESNTVIRLTSKHCLNIYLPGCNCRTGYVERSSMCVEPEQCLYDEKQKKYLSRIEFN